MRFSEVGPTNGLIAWWKLNDDVLDYSGNSYRCSVTGAPTIVSGIKNKAYNFTTNDRLTAPSGVYNNFGTNPFTISAWIKTSSTGGQICVVSTSPSGLGFRFGLNAGQVYYLMGGTIKFQEGWLGGIINDNKWHMVTSIYNPNSGVTGYVDVNQVGSVSFASGSVTYGSNLWINSMSGSSGGSMAGSISDVRIYNRALSLNEINILYNIGTNTSLIQLSDDGTLYLSGQLKEV